MGSDGFRWVRIGFDWFGWFRILTLFSSAEHNTAASVFDPFSIRCSAPFSVRCSAPFSIRFSIRLSNSAKNT